MSVLWFSLTPQRNFLILSQNYILLHLLYLLLSNLPIIWQSIFRGAGKAVKS